MKVSARLLLSAHLLTYGSALWATPPQEIDAAIEDHPSLLNLPPEVLEHVVSYTTGSGQSIDRDALALRETCHTLKAIVDDTFQRTLGKSFNLFLPDKNHLLPHTYKKGLIDTFLLKQDGFFFVPQGSLLEGELSKDYARINLYPYLQENSTWAGELYQVLFDQTMPTEDLSQERALKYLTACLPINHIYGAKGEQNPSHLLDQFKERHGSSLKRTLEKMKASNSYFLVGLDDDKAKLKDKPHLIVVNQSETADLRVLQRDGYLPRNHPHTLVLNADQKVLSFVKPPRYIGRLIVTNGDNQCTSIEDNFLRGCTSLTALNTQGLSNLTSIGDRFLASCTNLTTFNAQGLSSLTSIRHNFLWRCTSLTTFNTQGLSNLTSIGCGFLDGCTSLTTFNAQGLSNLTSIEYSFLEGCTSLTAFDTQGLSNLTSIGGWFLGNCTNLTTFNTRGLSNLTSIGDRFLVSCTSLTAFDTQGLFNLTSIGEGFLWGCINLTTFDTRGLSNLTSIEDWFLNGCTSLTAFDTQGLFNLTSIGDSFLFGCASLTAFDTRGLSNLINVGYVFLGNTPLAHEEVRQQILNREHLSKPGAKEQS
jgi:hypothetical protein